MNIQNQLIEFAEKLSLKEKALANVETVLDAGIESDAEFGIDFLEGQKKTDLVYQFGRYEFQVDKYDHALVVTRINIYSKKLYGPHFDVPVGYYTELTALDGEHIDEFLIFDWSPISFAIGYHIERINKAIPQRYFRRNVPEYEFASYVNHLTSLFQGRQFDGAIAFVDRGLDYLENSDRPVPKKEYLSECLELFHGVYHFVKNEHLIETDRLSKLRIQERIKARKQAVAEIT